MKYSGDEILKYIRNGNLNMFKIAINNLSISCNFGLSSILNVSRMNNEKEMFLIGYDKIKNAGFSIYKSDQNYFNQIRKRNISRL